MLKQILRKILAQRSCRFLAAAQLIGAVLAFNVSAQTSPTLTPLQKQIETERQRLSSSSDEERRDALMRLGSLHVAEASRACLPGLSDASPMIRAVAAGCVVSLPADQSVAALIPLLTDKDEFVRREVAFALGHTRSRQATVALTARLLTDKQESVRGAAAVALGEIADETAVVPLASVLSPETSAPAQKAKREKNAFVLRAVAMALGSIKSRAGTPALIAALANEKLDNDIRREAARSLGLIRDPSAVSALQTAAQASDPYLSEIAVAALKQLNR